MKTVPPTAPLALRQKLASLVRYTIFILLSVLITVMPGYSSVFASSNTELSIQTKVVNANGTNIANGSYGFRFLIYSVSSGGSSLWSEDHSVTISDGIMSTTLGGTNAFPSTLFTDNDNLYLQICFNANGAGSDSSNSNCGPGPHAYEEVFSTRKLITTVPYAYRAQSADNVINTQGVIKFQDVNTGEIQFSDGTYNSLPVGMTSILQALNAASGGGGGLWTINGNVTYLTSSGSDLSLSSTLVSAFSVDKSENLVRIGDGSTGNGKLDFFSSLGETGRLEYKNGDVLELSGGSFKVVDNTSIIFGTADNIRVNYNSTNGRVEFTDGTNVLAAITDGGTKGNLLVTGDIQSGTDSIAGSIQITDGSTNKVILALPSITADYTLTLPTTDGNANEVLTTNGTGTLSWVSPNITLSGDSGTDQTISPGNTIDIIGGNGINTSTTGTDTLSIVFDTTDNLTITGAWEFQDNVNLLFGTDSDIRVRFNGTDSLIISDGTNNLFSVIDTGTTGRVRIGSGTNDILSVGTSPDTVADGDLYWGNDLICDVSETNCGWASITGSSKWTDIGSTTHLTDTADDVAIGGTDATGAFFFNVAANTLNIGGDVNIFRGAANVLRTNDALTVDGAITGSSGATINGGNLLVQGTVPYNIIIDNSTTGADSNSGQLILRGNDFNGTTNTDIQFSLGTVISTTTSYKLSYFNNGGTEVGAIDQSGNLQVDGRVNLGTTTTDLLGTSAAGSAATNNLYWGDKLLCNTSLTNCGWAASSGESKWTDAGTYTYLTDTANDLVVGGNTTAGKFYFNTTAGQLVLNTNGSGGGIVLGSDTNLYRSAANILRTGDAFTADGLITGSAGALINGGNLTVQGTVPYNIIVDNSTTGADANSGLLILRGNDWDTATNTEIDFNIRTVVSSTTDYRISFLSDDAVTEVASIDETGNIQVDGRINIGTNTSDLLSVGSAGATANGDLYWGDDLLCDVSETNCGLASGSGSLFTDTGSITHLSQTGDNFAIGGTTLANSVFSIDLDSGNVTNLFTMRLGTGSTKNAAFDMYASDGDTGRIVYTTNDRWEFTGGSVLVGDDQSVFLGSDADFFMRYDETTDDRVEFGFGANQFGFINDVASQTYGTMEFSGTTVLGTGLTGTETALRVNTGAGFSGKLLDLDINGTNVFEVTSLGIRADVPATFGSVGNVQIANNLEFTNTVASYISSDSPLYITAGDIVSDEDLILKANNAGVVLVDDKLEVSDKIMLGANPTNLLSATVGSSAPTDNLYWGDKLLCDASKTNCGNALAIAGTLVYVSPTTNDFAVGSSSLTAAFSVDSSENLIRVGTGATQNAKVDLYSSNGNSMRLELTTADILEINNGGVIFNQPGDAVDFVIEGDTDANLFIADGSADAIGIGTATPAGKVHIKGTADDEQLIVDANATQSLVTEFVKFRNSSGQNLIVFTASGGAVFNEQGLNADFRVEGDNDQDLFFVDASADSVGIGTSIPNAKVQILGSFSVKRTSTAASISSGDEVIIGVTDTTAARTVTLSTDDVKVGRILIIKDESGAANGTNKITIDTEGAELIDGAASVDITTGYGVIRLYSDGTNWYTF